ncbi:hypothetical protein GQ42DRAFT_103605, partial [Ramicandelaber brevisporus]
PDNHNGELQVTLRILISTKEAGVIIGKEGKQVADIRSAASVRAGVSKAVPNINDRIFTVTGPIENVAHAYAFVAQALIDNPITSSPPLLHAYAQHHPITTASLRLLVAHNLMGTIIGKGGAKIKQIQDMSGARVIATKEMLPQSTERIIEIHGTSDCVSKAVEEVAKCIVEDYERGIGTVMYNPNGRIPLSTDSLNGGSHAHPLPSSSTSALHTTLAGVRPSVHFGSDVKPAGTPPTTLRHPTDAPPVTEIRTQEISIPGDMVGCIIGKGGQRIAEIRRQSGARITIARLANDEKGERLFTIQGSPESNERALFLLYNQLDIERTRRLQHAAQQAAAQAQGA